MSLTGNRAALSPAGDLGLRLCVSPFQVICLVSVDLNQQLLHSTTLLKATLTPYNFYYIKQ